MAEAIDIVTLLILHFQLLLTGQPVNYSAFRATADVQGHPVNNSLNFNKHSY